MTTKRWIASGVLVVLAAGLCVAALTVPWGDDSRSSGLPSTDRLNEFLLLYQAGDSISVGIGDRFVVALVSNPSTGYEWTAAENPNVELVSSKQVNGSSSLVGSSGMQELTFKATKAGSSTLVMSYARSFEPDVPPAKTEKFPVSVR